MLDRAFISTWTERLRGEIPGTVAILLKGSYARGNPGPWSDLDFDVLVRDAEIADPYPVWIVDSGHGRLVHVSVSVESLDAWLDGFEHPARWSFGFPGREDFTILWAAPDVAATVMSVAAVHPPGEPELEDFLEELTKARNAHDRGDELLVRIAAQELAELCPVLLAPLNAPVEVGTRPEGLRAALDIPTAPEGYRCDMLRCLGLDGKASTVDDVLAAAERLVFGTLALMGANADTFSPLLSSCLMELLASGQFRAYLEQETPQEQES